MSISNIVIAPCGNNSYLFKESWLKNKEVKEFDLCLLFYHEEIQEPENYKDAEYFFHLKGLKYHMIYKLLTDIHPEWLNKYQYFYLLDDDIQIETKEINNLFELSKTFRSWISQAALTLDSNCSWPMLKQRKNCFLRFVGQIEVMAPLFDNKSLRECLFSFNYNKSSWGLDSVWSKALGYPEEKLMVFDQVLMKHTRPVGSGELYVKIGVDPHDEWHDITRHYGAKRHNYQEYGRLQFVDSEKNRLNFVVYKLQEIFDNLKRVWNDYDLFSRIANKRRQLHKLIAGK